jgi:hypothetical protein
VALISCPGLRRRPGPVPVPLAAAVVAVVAVVVAGCGTTRMAAVNSPAPPVELNVYINSQRVSVSPPRLGAGQITVLVSNQARRAVFLKIVGGGRLLAASRPIPAGANSQFRVDLSSGRYALATTRVHATDAQLTLGMGISPAVLRIGAPRPNGNNALLQP